MSLNASLNTALTGLQVSQSLMRVTANNIANAGTEGYTRKVGSLGSLSLGDVGAGVRIEDVTRQVDNFLVKQTNAQTSVVSAANTLSAFYVRLQDLFGTPENNSSIAGQLNELRSALEKLAVDSQQSVAQSTAVTSAEDVVNTLHTISTAIQGMRQEVDRQIGDGIDKINTELVNIDKLNVDIVRNKTLDQPTGELEDKRDMSLKIIAEQMDVKWFTNASNSLTLLTGSNYTLLDSLPRTIDFSSPSGVSKATVYPGGFQPIAVEGQTDDLTLDIQSGTIKSLIDMRDTILTGLQDQIDQLASVMADEINRAHNSAMPIPGPTSFTGLNQFDSSVLLNPADPTSIPLFPYDNGATIEYGTIQFAIIDSTGKGVGAALRVNLDEFVSEMENYVSTAIGGPFTYQLTVGDIVNMLNGAYAATPPAGGTVTPTPTGWPGAVTWPPSPALVMPSSGSDIAGLYNMSGVPVSGAYSGGDFARVVNGALEIGLPSGSPYGLAIDDTDTTFTPIGETRSATFNYMMGLNNLFVIDPTAASPAANITVRSDILADPGRIGRGHLNSTLTDPTDPTTERWYVAAGDGSGASAMAGVFNSTITFSSTGGLAQADQRLTEYAASIIQSNARGASDASDNVTFQDSLLSEYTNRMGQISGVNIDEELAGLVTIQNAFAASSRVVTTVNSMFDDLISILR